MREEEKDKFYKFGERYYFDWNGIPDVLEGFISSLLSQKEKEVREEIIEEIINLVGDDHSARGQTISYARILGYLNKKIKMTNNKKRGGE